MVLVEFSEKGVARIAVNSTESQGTELCGVSVKLTGR